jgi:hypothetical protein
VLVLSTPIVCHHETKKSQPTSTPVPVLINGFPVGTGRTVYGSNTSGVISEEGEEEAEEDFIQR